MKNIFFIFLTLLSTSSHSSASWLVKEKAPIGGSVESLNIIRIGPDQGLYLIGEDHGLDRIASQENRRNFDMLARLLLKAEEEKAEKLYHVFVEHRADLLRTYTPNTVPATMMRGLLPLAQKKDFKYAVVESCEVRKIIGALQCLTQLHPTPETPRTHPSWDSLATNFQETFGFGITTLKFRDIISEFDRLKSQMEGYRDQWDDPQIQEEFNKSLIEADRLFSYLRSYLQGKVPCGRTIVIDNWTPFPITAPTDFDLDETIFSFCCRDQERRYTAFLCWIGEEMIFGFMNFLDLFLLHRILQLRTEANPVKKIIFVGGDGHCSPVMFPLLRAKCGQRVYWNRENFTCDMFVKIFKPLSEIEQLEKEKNDSWCVLL